MKESHPRQPAENQSDSSQVALPLQGKQVLLAEDCVDQGRLFLMFLQKAGVEVSLECNGQSAVDAVTKSPSLYEVVVMDFEMPKLDGLDATRQLRELGYAGAIIAVTAFGSEDLKETWFQAGCTDYLEKPLNKERLISAVLRNTATVQEAAHS